MSAPPPRPPPRTTASVSRQPSASTLAGYGPPQPTSYQPSAANALGGAPMSDQIVGVDPTTGKPLKEHEVYARTDGLVFASYANQAVYFKLLSQGLQLEWDKNGKPTFNPVGGERPVWELTTAEGNFAKINSRSELPSSTTTASLVEPGSYVLYVAAPQLENSYIGGASRRTVAVTFTLLGSDAHGQRKVYQNSFTVELTPETRDVAIPFTVGKDQIPAFAVLGFAATSLMSKLMVTAKIVLKASEVTNRSKSEYESARRSSTSVLRRDLEERVAEFEKDAKGAGVTFAWDPVRSVTFVKLIDQHGPVARSGQFKIGDQICGVQGKRVDGLPHKEVIRLLRSVPRQVVLITKPAPPGWTLESVTTGESRGPPPVARSGGGRRPPTQPSAGNRPPPAVPVRRTSSQVREGGAAAPPPLPRPSSGGPAPRAAPPPPRRDRTPAAALAMEDPTPVFAEQQRAPPPPPVKPATTPVTPSSEEAPVASPGRPARPLAPRRPQPPPPPPSPQTAARLPPPSPQPAARLPPPAPVPRQPSQRIEQSFAAPPPPEPEAPAVARAPPKRPSSRGRAPPPPPTATPTPPPALQIETSPASPTRAPAVSTPSQEVSSSYGPVYEKYVRMRRSGLPDGAVLNAMGRDGVEPPPGFFDASFDATISRASVVIPTSHTPSGATPVSDDGGGGGLLGALAGFDRSKLKAAPPPSEAPESGSGGGGLVSALAGFDRSKLRHSTHDPNAARDAREKEAKTGFAGVFAAALDERRKYIADDEDADEDDDADWEM